MGLGKDEHRTRTMHGLVAVEGYLRQAQMSLFNAEEDARLAFEWGLADHIHDGILRLDALICATWRRADSLRNDPSELEKPPEPPPWATSASFQAPVIPTDAPPHPPEKEYLGQTWRPGD